MSVILKRGGLLLEVFPEASGGKIYKISNADQRQIPGAVYIEVQDAIDVSQAVLKEETGGEDEHNNP